MDFKKKFIIKSTLFLSTIFLITPTLFLFNKNTSEYRIENNFLEQKNEENENNEKSNYDLIDWDLAYEKTFAERSSDEVTTFYSLLSTINNRIETNYDVEENIDTGRPELKQQINTISINELDSTINENLPDALLEEEMLLYTNGIISPSEGVVDLNINYKYLLNSDKLTYLHKENGIIEEYMLAYKTSIMELFGMFFYQFGNNNDSKEPDLNLPSSEEWGRAFFSTDGEIINNSGNNKSEYKLNHLEEINNSSFDIYEWKIKLKLTEKNGKKIIDWDRAKPNDSFSFDIKVKYENFMDINLNFIPNNINDSQLEMLKILFFLKKYLAENQDVKWDRITPYSRRKIYDNDKNLLEERYYIFTNTNNKDNNYYVRKTTSLNREGNNIFLYKNGESNSLASANFDQINKNNIYEPNGYIYLNEKIIAEDIEKYSEEAWKNEWITNNEEFKKIIGSNDPNIKIKKIQEILWVNYESEIRRLIGDINNSVSMNKFFEKYVSIDAIPETELMINDEKKKILFIKYRIEGIGKDSSNSVSNNFSSRVDISIKIKYEKTIEKIILYSVLVISSGIILFIFISKVIDKIKNSGEIRKTKKMIKNKNEITKNKNK